MVFNKAQDKGVGVAIPFKILIIIAQAIAWGQLLLIPLDVSNSSSIPFQTMEIIYSVIYWFMLFLCLYIIPFSMSLYESSDNDSWVSRICWALLFSTILCAVLIAVIFISYIWLGVYTVAGVSNTMIPGLYIMICLALAGWILLAINGGIGLVWIPHDLILYFVNRPKQLTVEDAFQKKKLLQQNSDKLVETGQLLKIRGNQFKKTQAEKGWFQRRKQESDLKSSLQFYKEEVTKLQEQHEIFDKQLTISKTHPLLYWVSLFFGILAGVMSLIWFVQLVGTVIYNGGVPIFLFIDQLLYDLANGPVSFMATGIYAVMVLYLLACAIKGNLVFGIRIPYVISFHAMKPNKTLMNSFLFNVNLMMLSSLAITQLSIITFRTYLQNTYLYSVFVGQVYLLPMFGWIYQNRVFPAALLIVILMAVVSAIIKAVNTWRKKGKQQSQTTVQQNGKNGNQFKDTDRQMKEINHQ